ncbi:hypothetical protein N7505_007758 [Penicillium chrysogenum]|uniref:Uncharacterized protein n=1 Tax=Penicillium chrysogenum TaxID=5076 RepID=A0ABQ8WEA3_PENCH|nr:hypothetical protein N7505_007758 [Penicillium chrysogenum]
MTHPEVPTLFANQGQAHMERWKYLAAKTIILAYPKDPQLLPMEYTEVGASLIPTLIRALSYLHELRRSMLEWHILELGIDACLSASNFGDKPWKMVAVAYADIIANMLGCADISARVQLRRASLARLYKAESAPNSQNIQIPRTNKRSNADFGRLVMLQARLQIEQRVPSKTINQTLDQFSAVSPVSELEKSVQLEINFLRAKLHRYDGKFDIATQILEGFMQAVRYRTHNMIMIHYYETLCESGHPATAIQILKYELEELLKKENGHSGSARRLKLALGGSYLMKFLTDRPSCFSLLDQAEGLFQSIQWPPERSIVTNHNYYVSKASLGMICLLKSQGEKSLTYWDEAMEAARDCFPKTGHAETLIHYAQSEVLYRLGRHQEATAKRAVAQEKFAEYGREYYFLGQGTAWLDTLDGLATDSERQAIAADGSNGLGLVPLQ